MEGCSYPDITLRPMDISDADDFFEWYSDEKVSEFCSWDAFVGVAEAKIVDLYVIGSAYWGKGIATQAVKLAAKAVFLEWEHLERLEAVTDVENLGSQRVLEKAGFTREGVFRKYYLLKGKVKDAVMFSLLSPDP